MGRVFPNAVLQRTAPPRPEYDVVCIGLTGAGKSSLLSRLCSEVTDCVIPTTGFSIKAVPFQNAILNVKELGGADSIKKYWSRYYQGSQGVVFILDSASSEEDLEVARAELHSALQHPQLCTLPFLILANHQDKPAARSVQEPLSVAVDVPTDSGATLASGLRLGCVALHQRGDRWLGRSAEESRGKSKHPCNAGLSNGRFPRAEETQDERVAAERGQGCVPCG
ncbi:hypothetical protein ANANG_G00196500 [Anguilla anguilla]|uniref:ADP-ribosylation factor-like protein 15 n=1 Tax=Anguilla anguilla TaxID=7936 RepID=A0A9D3M904_ANGAN|nr:hypothetical protein ANANG_G00196500 [Anguilla anguilla]